ncbi:acyl-CoA N-acyltransferase [Catenaria anguillulae PL171]|uniref:Acyl-CoA N-acyltransferase n=1 Tax=Catenaria anguillulae PL171 TaxID=765915 RepID=A0A1Y2HN16_9FUNG|nr:acyl-CoA N-acyltransferase [Catenaria anguillulae PL171]
MDPQSAASPPTATKPAIPSRADQPGTDSLPPTPLLSYEPYEGEQHLPEIMDMIEGELSEPYSIYTYRFFVHAWPDLTILCRDKNDASKLVGVIVCKIDPHKHWRRGYIGMLAVNRTYRKQGIGRELVRRAIVRMVEHDCDEVVLEADATNTAALRLYESLGFLRDKRLARYYVSGNDAFRLKLWLKPDFMDGR